MTSTHSTGAQRGWVYLVGAGPGDPGLLTARALELLASADLVLHDELVDLASLEFINPAAEVRSVGKRGSDPSSKQLKQEAIQAELIAQARHPRSVVRLKGGDPFLFGRGSEEAQALSAAGIPFEVVPGVCAPLGACAYAGIPLTHRKLARSVTFLTAALRNGALFDWSELQGLQGTLCIFMGARRLAEICEALIHQAHRPADTPAAVVQWISYPQQRTISGTLGDLAEKASSLGTPSLIIVGDVVSLREHIGWFEQQPLFGKRVLLLRPEHQLTATATMLRRRGAEVIAFPTIALEEPPDPEAVSQAIQKLSDYDLVAFTSQNGVNYFWDALRAHQRDARAFGSAQIAAIGPATASSLVEHGLYPDIVAEKFVAESLGEAIIKQLKDNGKAKPRVLLPRALVARETLITMLQDANIALDVVPVYQTVNASEDRQDELLEIIDSIDIVMLTSSSTVEKLVSLLGADATERLSGAQLASIGPITTATAQQLGLTVHVTATTSTTAGMVEALEGAPPDDKEPA